MTEFALWTSEGRRGEVSDNAQIECTVPPVALACVAACASFVSSMVHFRHYVLINNDWIPLFVASFSPLVCEVLMILLCAFVFCWDKNV